MAAASWLLFGATAVLLFISIWIIVPAPNLLLLSLGVAAPELSSSPEPVAVTAVADNCDTDILIPSGTAGALRAMQQCTNRCSNLQSEIIRWDRDP